MVNLVANVADAALKINDANQTMAEKAASAEFATRSSTYAAQLKLEANVLDEDTGLFGFETAADNQKRADDALMAELRDKYKFKGRKQETNWKISTDAARTSTNNYTASWAREEQIKQGTAYMETALLETSDPETAYSIIGEARNSGLISEQVADATISNWQANFNYKSMSKEVDTLSPTELADRQKMVLNGESGTDRWSDSARSSYNSRLARAIENKVLQGVHLAYSDGGSLAAAQYIEHISTGKPGDIGAVDAVQQKKITSSATTEAEKLAKFDAPSGGGMTPQAQTTDNFLQALNNSYLMFGEKGPALLISELRAGGREVTETDTATEHSKLLTTLNAEANRIKQEYERIKSFATVETDNRVLETVLTSAPNGGNAAWLATPEGKKAFTEWDSTVGLKIAQLPTDDFYAIAPDVLTQTSALGVKSDTVIAAVESDLKSASPEDILASVNLINNLKISAPYASESFKADDVNRASFIANRLSRRGYDKTSDNVVALDKEYLAIKGLDEGEKTKLQSSARDEWAANSGNEPEQYFRDVLTNSGVVDDSFDGAIDEEVLARFREEYYDARLLYNPSQSEKEALNRIRGRLGVTSYGDELRVEFDSPEIVISPGVLTPAEHRENISKQTSDMVYAVNAQNGTDYKPADIQREFRTDGSWNMLDMNGDYITILETDENGNTYKRPVIMDYEVWDKTESPAERKKQRQNQAAFSTLRLEVMDDLARNVPIIDNQFPALPVGDHGMSAEQQYDYANETWQNLRYDEKVSISSAYSKMKTALEKFVPDGPSKESDIQWYLLMRGYFTANEDGSAIETPPGWEFQYAD